MATLLYRLGHGSARRPFVVIAAWLAVLAAAGGSFVAFGGQLTSTFSIPGTETDRVTDQLAEEIPDAARGTATVVFQREDGEALDEGQRAAISELLAGFPDIEGVYAVVDPFETEQRREQAAQQTADGLAQVDQGRVQLEGARAQLDDAQAQLDAAASQAAAAGGDAAVAAQFEAQQAQLDAQRTQLEQRSMELQAGAEQAELGEQLQQYAEGVGTVSGDGSTAVARLVFEGDSLNVPAEVRTEIIDRLEGAGIAGVDVNWSTELADQAEGVAGPGEVIGLVVAALVLLLMLRAVLPSLVPLLSSLLGVGVGVTAALAFSDVVTMNSVTPVLGVMLGVAVGIDYSLFIINRHRRQVRAGMGVAESAGLADGTAGNAVVFAGATVVIALLALQVTGIGFLGVMGTVAAVCVAVAVLMAVTMTPALLGLLGLRVLGWGGRRRAGSAQHATTAPRPMGTARAALTSALVVVALLVLAVPALSIRLGLPTGASEPPDSVVFQAYDAVSDAFGEGANATLVVLAEPPAPVAEADVLATQVDIAGRLAGTDRVEAVAPIGVSEDGSAFAFQVVPQEGPSSVETERLVNDLRSQSPLADGTTLGVAGRTGANIDVSQKLADALPLYIGVVVGLSFVILVVVFRSLLVPLVATGGYVLSLFAALGAVTAVYQWGWLGPVFGVAQPGPVLSFAPTLLAGVLFGLAMDYQLFVTSGMREAFVHGRPARVAVVEGLRLGRTVVMAAAIIMASVFAGFIFSGQASIRPIGFSLAAGVLLDAFVVRLTLVPALMHLMGESAWWLPRWLDRLLPNIDIEGAGLERDHPVPGGHGEVTSPPEAVSQPSR